MNIHEQIITRLHEIIALEDSTPVDLLGSYIVGALIVDDEASRYSERNRTLSRIADLGSDLETNNGTPDELSAMWEDIKSLIKKLTIAD
jgi:hypothetical protein